RRLDREVEMVAGVAAHDAGRAGVGDRMALGDVLPGRDRRGAVADVPVDGRVAVAVIEDDVVRVVAERRIARPDAEAGDVADDGPAVRLVRMQSPMRVDLNLPEDRVGPRPRRASKRVWVGGVPVGDGAPIAVQSMCTTLTHDVDATIRQIERLQEAGCEIVRVAVPDKRGAEALKEIVRRSILPIVADIHFDYRLALMALDAKVHKLRLNP